MPRVRLHKVVETTPVATAYNRLPPRPSTRFQAGRNAENWNRLKRIELLALKESSYRFAADYCITDHPIHGMRRFPPFPYLDRLFHAFDHEKRLLVLKSRQVMASWSVAAWLLHRALFHGSADYVVLSKEERSAKELLSRIKNLARRLPAWMGVRAQSTRNKLAFPTIGSRIFVLPAVPEAVRQHVPTAVIWDEMAFTRDAVKIWEALSPALDSDAIFIGISTPNGRYNLFGRLIENAPEQGFGICRIHYSDRPDRGESWLQSKRRELSEAEWRREFELSLEEGHGLRVLDCFSPLEHVRNAAVSGLEIHDALRRFRALDFGYQTPVVLWIAELSTGQFVVFDEWVGSQTTRTELLDAIHSVDRKWGLTEETFAWSACDPAGAQQSDSGLPVADFLRGGGIKLCHRRSLVEDGLDILRTMFRTSAGTGVLSISPACKRLVDDLSSYQYDERTGKPIKGVHDHTVDALRYFAIMLQVPPHAVAPSRVAGIQRNNVK